MIWCHHDVIVALSVLLDAWKLCVSSWIRDSSVSPPGCVVALCILLDIW